MEYIISSKKIDNSKKFGNLYFVGNFTIVENNIRLIEGYFDGEEKESLIKDIDIFDKLLKGIFNIISYNKTTNILNIKNDHLGQLMVYYAWENNHFILSNNFWKVYYHLNPPTNNINNDYIKSKLYFLNSHLQGQTYFKSINYLLPASVYKFNFNNKNLLKEYYWDWNIEPINEISFNEQIKTFDNDMNRLFSDIKKRYKTNKIGFGNSGGLDSRLIAYYGKEHGLNLVGITIQDKYPGLFKTATYQNSEKIAKYFGFKNYPLYYNQGNFKQQLFLDIRNNPLGGNQMFKNPIDLLPEFDVYLTGQHGYMVGRDAWGSFLNKLNEKETLTYYFYYICRHKFFPSKYRTFTNRILKYFKGIDYKALDIKKISDTPLNEIFTKEEKESYLNYIQNFLNTNKDLNYLNKIRKFHQNNTGQLVYNGGFESLSRTKETYFSYYPYAFFNSLNWNYDYLIGKKMLKNLIKLKSSFLFNMPNQNLIYLTHRNPVQRIGSKLELIARGNGLMYISWIKNKQYINLYNEIFNRKNPLFENIISEKLFTKLNLRNVTPHGSIDFIKIKKVLDIIYFNESEFIFNSKFNIK